MKKELRSALEAMLGESIPAHLETGYRRLKPLPRQGEGFVFPGEIVYVNAARPGFCRFVCVIPVQQRDAYTVELGWSTDGQFPVASARPSTSPQEAAASAPPQGFVRLSEFYSHLGEDWDVAPIDARDPGSVMRMFELQSRKLAPGEPAALLRPLVEDTLTRLREHAPAFFESLEGRTAGLPSN